MIKITYSDSIAFLYDFLQTNKAASSHLKSLLGLGLCRKDPPSNSMLPASETHPTGNLSSLSKISDNDGQQQKQQQLHNTLLRTEDDLSVVKNLSNGWQVPTKEMKTTSLSLREIMQQEELLHTNSEKNTIKAEAITWAAKAAQGSPYNKNLNVPYNGRPGNYSGQPSRKSVHNYVELSVPIHDQKTSSESNFVMDSGVDLKLKETNDSLSENMTQEFSDWCSNQLLKIKGNGDLTLVSFCLTIDSAAEIRETLAAYLGSTPQVSQFATEFIRKKEDRENISQSGFQKVTKKKSAKGKNID